jgi:hypothetical protein
MGEGLLNHLGDGIMANTTDPYFQNKREFSRVDAHIPMEVRLVSEEERQNIRSRVEGKEITGIKLPPDVDDPALSEWLKLLHAKIDAILRLISVGGQKEDSSPYKTKNISGGGVSFTSTEKFSLGDIIEIKIFPFAIISQALYLYGDVVQAGKRDNNYFTAVRFISLDDALRDEIIRFVFEKERQILREKRKE